MKNSIRFICCLFMLNGFSLSLVHAQNLTGIWRGHFRSNDGLERLAGSYDDRYKMEVQIAQTHNHFEAVTYSYKSAEFYGKAEATGSLNPQSKKVLLKEEKLLEVRLASGYVCIMTCFLRYTRLGDDEYLQGTYYSTNSNDSTVGCGKGSIFLHRVLESDFHKEPFLMKKEKELLALENEEHIVKKPSVPAPAKTSGSPGGPVVKTPSKKTPAKKQPAKAPDSQSLAAGKKTNQEPQPGKIQIPGDSSENIYPPENRVPVPPVLRNRTNSVLKTLTVNHTSVEIRIYDDGAIDNDTVSVYYDNKLLISRARLSDQPITVRLPVEPSEHPHQLVMVAENLGDIPPNTSLLVVRDGEKRYEERIISTEQKNIVLNFQYKKIE